MLRDASAMLKEIEDQLKSCSGNYPFKFTLTAKIPGTQNPDSSRNWILTCAFFKGLLVTGPEWCLKCQNSVRVIRYGVDFINTKCRHLQ